MTVDLAGVIRDVQLTTLAFAIALGWSLYQTALGLATFIEGLSVRGSGPFVGSGFVGLSQEGFGLTWVWHHHLFDFGQFVLGRIELGTVLLVAVLVRRFSARSAAPAE